jgi:hypothetical protein
MTGDQNKNTQTVAGNASGQEAVWFIYSGGQQIGPFTTDQAGQLVARKAVAADSYVFRIGWKDWRPVEECYEELGLPPAGKINAASLEDRRKVAPRASVSGRVVIHNNGNLTIGTGVNISTSGIFVETNEPIFTIGEKLKLSVKADGMDQPFNAVAQVIRYNSDPRFPMGYGLKFEVLSDRARGDIRRLVDGNKGGVAPKVARG